MRIYHYLKSLLESYFWFNTFLFKKRIDANKEKISSVECLFKSFADYQLFWISP